MTSSPWPNRLSSLRENLRSVAAGAPLAVGPLDVVVTPNELNDLHGTGFLVKRVFAGWRSVLSLRTRDDYSGVHDFGPEARRLDVKGLRRTEVYRIALDVLARRPVGRVFSVPYTAEDLLLALAIRDVAGAPLCIWIMDDQCVATSNLPRPLMREALERSALRLATHAELRDAYEAAFGLPFGILPAVVPSALVRRQRSAGAPPSNGRGALLGSVWSRRWLDLLAAALRGAGMELDWYGNHRAPVLGLTDGDLAAMPFRPHGIVPEPALAAALASHSFVVVPTGTLEGEAAEQHALAELSLPGRILFAVAVAHAPILVIGSERTPAAAFVRRHGLGLAIPYDAAALRDAVRTLCGPAEQARIRSAAAALAASLSDEGVGAWLKASIAHGSPVDDRFERVFPRAAPARGTP